MAAFVEANAPVDFQPTDRASAYEFVARTLSRLGYRTLEKPSKALVKRFLAKTTSYSRAQLTRLIRQYRETAKVVDRHDGNQGRPFARVYTPADVRRLARVDADLGQTSGLATRVVLQREFHLFGDAGFERLAGISASHIDNLRASRSSRTQRAVVAGTKASAVAVGVRRSPARLPARRHRALRATATAPRACIWSTSSTRSRSTASTSARSAVYLGDSLALAGMELLVHLGNLDVQQSDPARPESPARGDARIGPIGRDSGGRSKHR